MFTIDIVVELSFGISWPEYQFNFQNQHMVISTANSSNRLVHHTGTVNHNVALTWSQKLSCETVLENGHIVRDQTVEINKVVIDGILIPKHLLTKISWYEPHYRADFLDYCANQNIEIQNSPQSILKFWHAGIWNLPLPTDFWFKYHSVRQNNTHSDHTGNSSELILNNLSRLKKLL